MMNVVQGWQGYRPQQVQAGPKTAERDAIKREPGQIEMPQQRNSTYDRQRIELNVYCSACFFSTCFCCVQVGDPMSYHRESWMMEKDEKLQTVPLLHMQGNALVKQRQFREAASKYKEAVLLLKIVQSRVSPKRGDGRRCLSGQNKLRSSESRKSTNLRERVAVQTSKNESGGFCF